RVSNSQVGRSTRRNRRAGQVSYPQWPVSDTGRVRTRRGSCSAADLHCYAGVDLGSLDEPVDLEALAELDVHQAGRGAVVDGRDAVARERGGVAEPARHVALGLRAEHALVRVVDGGHELVTLLDLRPGRGHVDLALELVV